MSYLLDTNICVAIIRKKSTRALTKVISQPKSALSISIVTAAELEFGAKKRKFTVAQQKHIEQFIISFNVVLFEMQDIAIYGDIRADLETKGTPIGMMDTIIAAQAVSRKLILVTNNVREFSRVSSLTIEDWTV